MSSPVLTEDCPTCGRVISGSYCDDCGERRPSQRAYTLGEFVHETFEVFTNVERSFLRTVWTLVRRPGELTTAYMRGQRVGYLRPFQLFLLLNLIFFFTAGGGVTMYSTPLHTHLESTPYKERAKAVVADWRPATGMTMKEYERAFDAKALVLARTLVVLLAPAFAVGIAILSVNRSQSFVKAIVFGLHAIGVLMLLTSVVVWGTVGIIKGLHAVGVHVENQFDAIATPLLLAAFGVYMYLALRRAYGDGRVGALVKAGVSLVMFMYLLVGYRLLLFYVTVYTL
jgi:hypothetical protein